MIENFKSKEKINIDNDDITIEHILPQSQNNLEWRSYLGEDYDRISMIYLHTLGNLTLTGYNPELGGKSFEKKKELLRDSKVKITFLNEDILSQEKWDEQAIRGRIDKIGRLLNSIYQYPKWSGKIYKTHSSNNNSIKINFDNIEQATNKNVESFYFLGNDIPIKAFNEVLIEAIKIVFRYSEEAKENIDILAKQNKFKMTKNFPDEKSSGPWDFIEECDIWINKHGNSIEILKTIKNLLFELNIPTDDFIVVVKNKEK